MSLQTSESSVRTKQWSKPLVGVGVVILVGGAIVAAFVLKSLPSTWSWEMISWRMDVFTDKLEGKIPDLSWRELWFMTHARGGFGLQGFIKYGFSMEGAVVNPFTSNDDHQIGAEIFRQHCAVCHGNEGKGSYAPALNHSGLSRGDSELAMYKVVRDGISQTGMAPVSLSLPQRWQVIGYIRTLQLSTSTQQPDHMLSSPIQVSSEQIRAAASRPDEWVTYSGSLDGRRYSSLDEINATNVSRLRVRWIRQFDMSDSARNESTPIVVDGTIFTVDPPADVVAVDARSGELKWRYRRSLPDKLPTCCARTNRGLAVLGSSLFFGSLEGNLVALNATDGRVIWESKVADPSDGFTMTGAPLVVNHSVIVGVAGGEFGIRGFLAAYDGETGRQQWKFNTIPGPGELGHDTWKNDAWRTGGGPTWVTGSYDPMLDLIYWGVGNPAPGLQGDVRPGDNLFTDSVLALRASSGELAWYFQFTPHDEHDRDATQTPILADLPINGVLRRVMCVANRNGFYYVLDRTNGTFLGGVPFVIQNWAKGLDSGGRPILATDAEVSPAGRLTRPGVEGGINWQNTALDLKSRLIFIPATEGGSVFTKSPNPKRGELGFYPGSSGSDYSEPEERVVRALDAATGVKKWERWERSLPGSQKSLASGYSGLLATGGGLVFGASGGFAFAIDSTTGQELWRVFLGGDTYAAPISFALDGRQVVLMSAGRAMLLFGL